MNDLYNNVESFDIKTEDLQQFDAVKTGTSQFHILKEAAPYHAEIIQTDFINKQYTVKVNSNIYIVDIANQLDILIKEMGFSTSTSKQVSVIKAPMPGLVLEISVQVGQEVNENDPLLILEAMKMENSILSPRTGIIKSVLVVKGQAVDKNQMLIEFE
jgi:biotin carboxyl carrier protein